AAPVATIAARYSKPSDNPAHGEISSAFFSSLYRQNARMEPPVSHARTAPSARTNDHASRCVSFHPRPDLIDRSEQGPVFLELIPSPGGGVDSPFSDSSVQIP